MQSEQFQLHAQIEERHWWFVGRRRILRELVRKIAPQKSSGASDRNARPIVVDIGCGTGANLAALTDEFALPLADAAVDRVLLVHALEMSHEADALLREVWRVLASGGRLLAVVPNRRGLWARMDTTPFGHGRPYSRSQIVQLLRETWFTPTGWSEALYVPPIARGWFLRSAGAWERTGSTLSAPFAGVHIVEASKQVYRAIPARRERQRLVPALEPVLAPSPGG